MPSRKAQDQAKALANVDFDFITGPKDLGLLRSRVAELREHRGVLAVDTETTGLDPLVNQVRLVQVGTADFALIVDLDGWRTEGERTVPWEEPGLRELKDLLESPAPKVLQNAAFDLNFLMGEGVVLGGQLFDTMIAAKIVNNGTGAKNDLGSIVNRVLKVPLPKELQKADWGGEISREMLEYAARDVVCLPRLVPELSQALKQSKVREAFTLWEVFKLEMEVVRPIATMQWHGFEFDEAGARELEAQLIAEADALKVAFLEELDKQIKALHPDDPHIWLPRDPDGSVNTREKDTGSKRLGTKQLKGFNPRAPKQMAERFEQAGILLPPDEKGAPSLDQNLLAFLRKEYSLIDQYLEWKSSVTKVSNIQKLLESIGPDGRIHAGYRQMGTETGRLSCSGPNLQQVNRGKDFRSKFVADDNNVLVVADFSQVELRAAAELSGEERMIEAYLNGRDLHTETAALMAGIPQEEVTKEQRQSAKVCFSGDTEVLTESGWVPLVAYSGQRVAQYVLPAGVELNRKVKKPGPGYVAGLPPAWDGNCGGLEFVEPLHFDSFESDDVWAASDRNVDIVATGNHEIFYIDAYGNAIKRPLIEVQCPRLFVAGGYLERSGDLGELRSRVLAMVVADGSFKQTPNWVSLGFSKRRKIHRCQELLEQAGIEYKKARYSNGENGYTTFFRFKLQEADWLLQYVDVDKRLNFQTCMRDVDALGYLGEAQYWDGLALEGRSRDRVIVSTTVKQTADVMQAMAVSAGLPCTVNAYAYMEDQEAYKVSYAFRTVPTWRVNWEPKRVEAQRVYCVQVPSSLVLIRRNGKVCVQGNCNFGLLYGAGPATLRKQSVAQYGLDIDMDEARRLVEGFRTAYPTLYEWQQSEGTKTTAAVFTKLGRRRMLVGFNDKYTTRINTQVQGSAGDVAKIAIKLLWKEITAAPVGQARLIAMVHDEIVLEVEEAHAEEWSVRLKACMEEAGGQICTKVPIVAEVSSGKTWADAK